MERSGIPVRFIRLLFRTLRARNNALRMVIHLLLGAKRLTTSGCSRQALRQTRLPPVLLLIRSALDRERSCHALLSPQKDRTPSRVLAGSSGSCCRVAAE